MNSKSLVEQMKHIAGEEAIKTSSISAIVASLESNDYNVVEVNIDKPWGGYVRVDSTNADAFIGDFFENMSVEDAKFGLDSVELSPKILVVSSGERLSLQTHERRAECWRFLTPGSYTKGLTTEGDENICTAGVDEVVQFATGEVHRLNGNDEGLAVVAEIWQHTDKNNLSDEQDITRLQDDYRR